MNYEFATMRKKSPTTEDLSREIFIFLYKYSSCTLFVYSWNFYHGRNDGHLRTNDDSDALQSVIEIYTHKVMLQKLDLGDYYVIKREQRNTERWVIIRSHTLLRHITNLRYSRRSSRRGGTNCMVQRSLNFDCWNYYHRSYCNSSCNSSWHHLWVVRWW